MHIFTIIIHIQSAYINYSNSKILQLIIGPHLIAQSKKQANQNKK